MTKKTTYLSAVILILVITCTILPAQMSGMANTWDNVERIAGNISKPTFPESWVSIQDFGAKENDRDNSAGNAINRAILFMSRQGGGTVIIPGGEWLTGAITMKSNVCLKLAENAILRFLPEKEFYFPAVPTRIDGIDCNNTHPLIYAYGERNIAITGKGTIDAEEVAFPQNQTDTTLINWSINSTAAHKRTFTVENGLNPQVINFCLCTTALIEGITILNAPSWAIHPLLCEDFIIRDIKTDSQSEYSNGCNPESCKDILIDGCEFGCLNNGITVRSGRNEYGSLWNSACENIVVRNCHIQNGKNGIVIGNEIAGGCKNIYIEECRISSENLKSMIELKTSPARGGTIENIYFRNIETAACKESAIKISLKDADLANNADNADNADNAYKAKIATTFIKNIYLDGINCSQSEYGLWISGMDNPKQINNINIENCIFNGVKKGGNHIEGTFSDIFFRKSKINDMPAIL